MEGGEEEGEGKGEVDEEEEKVDKGGEGEVVGTGLLGDHYRPFTLPSIWSVNEFPSKMLKRLPGKLHSCFQIPNDVPLRMVGKREKCYRGR